MRGLVNRGRSRPRRLVADAKAKVGELEPRLDDDRREEHPKRRRAGPSSVTRGRPSVGRGSLMPELSDYGTADPYEVAAIRVRGGGTRGR